MQVLKLKLLIKHSEIPSIGNGQEYPRIKISSLSAKNKAKFYDETLAYFVAGIKYKENWYIDSLVSINDREIGPGTVIISSNLEVQERKNVTKVNGIYHNNWRHLVAGYLGLKADMPEIERMGFAVLCTKCCILIGHKL